MSTVFLMLAAVAACANAAIPTPADYEITSLPGLTQPLPFKQYAGYMEATPGTQMFFWFVECVNDPANAPVALWLNGGPGSSSVAYGFWTEHGPFRLSDNHTVTLYDYAWNRLANVIYLEAPSGVGFSFSDDPAHYHTNDTQASLDNYMFLLNFFKTFPQFATNDFYVTGESYGGHYVPTLAKRILDNRNNDDGGLYERMRGFWIGNPGIDSDWYYNTNEYAFVTYLWSHGLLPQPAYTASVAACGWDQFLTNCSRDFTHPSLACREATKAALKYVPQVWDPYNVLAPTCHDPSGRVDATVTRNTPWLAALREKYDLKTQYNPCINDYTPEYMNRPDVQAAIHAVDPHNANRTWPDWPPGWKYGSEKADIAKLFPEFFAEAPQWRIMVVSGDADAAVPFIDSQQWVECLARPVVQDWVNWFLDQDVAGSYKEYDGIAFATVKGCGHTIPTYCPEAGLAMWSNYLFHNWTVSKY